MNNSFNSVDPKEVANARVVVRAVLEEFGVDLSTPEARNEARKDFLFLRDWRHSSETIRGLVAKSFIVTCVAAVLGVIWLGLQQALIR